MNERKYTKRKRAEQEAQTRRRIVEAAMHLHEEVGPRETSIRAVAERAGVQRLTVYRHFPDDQALFRACTTHWLDLHPPPDPATWARHPDGATRTGAALEALYTYYGATAQMWARAYRDMDTVPALAGPMAQFEAYLDGVRDGLLEAWHPNAGKQACLHATVGHTLCFRTWESLRAAGLEPAEAAALAARWVAAVA